MELITNRIITENLIQNNLFLKDKGNLLKEQTLYKIGSIGIVLPSKKKEKKLKKNFGLLKFYLFYLIGI